MFRDTYRKLVHNLHEQHIVSFSGGKDSTCMLLMMIEKHMRIDKIIFADSGAEFDEIITHVKDVEKYINRKIERVYWDIEKYLKYYTTIMTRWCTGKKVSAIRKAHNSFCQNYVGAAIDEAWRKKDKCYPLMEWNVTEAQALQYCYDKGFYWQGLYEKFDRTGCWCCPYQSIESLYTLYYPSKWEYLIFFNNE